MIHFITNQQHPVVMIAQHHLYQHDTAAFTLSLSPHDPPDMKSRCITNQSSIVCYLINPILGLPWRENYLRADPR